MPIHDLNRIRDLTDAQFYSWIAGYTAGHKAAGRPADAGRIDWLQAKVETLEKSLYTLEKRLYALEMQTTRRS
jgi:hypothetical protein